MNTPEAHEVEVWTTEQVRSALTEAMLERELHDVAAEQHGAFVSLTAEYEQQLTDAVGVMFDRWLNALVARAKAEAWDEGHDAAESHETAMLKWALVAGRLPFPPPDDPENPYRAEGATS